MLLFIIAHDMKDVQEWKMCFKCPLLCVIKNNLEVCFILMFEDSENLKSLDDT